MLRVRDGRPPEPTAAIIDSRTLRSTPESGTRASYDGAKRKRGSKVHMAVDTLGHLLALHVTPANQDDRKEVGRLADAIQEATGQSVELAYVDQGYTGDRAAAAAAEHGIALEVLKLPEAKRGFVLLPRRWVVERSFAWATRCRRLVKDYERYATTLAGRHVVAFACFMMKHAASFQPRSITPSRWGFTFSDTMMLLQCDGRMARYSADPNGQACRPYSSTTRHNVPGSFVERAYGLLRLQRCRCLLADQAARPTS